MQLQVNEKHEITGYATVGGFVGGIERKPPPSRKALKRALHRGNTSMKTGRLWKI